MFPILVLFPQAGIVQPAHQPGGFKDEHDKSANLEGVAGVSLKEAARFVDQDSHLPIQPQPLRLKVSPFET